MAAAAPEAGRAELPALGAGLGYRPPFRSEIFLHRGRVDFLEITLDHYLAATVEKERELELLRENFTLIPHGLNLSLGSAEGLDREYLAEVAALIRRLAPPWWSEHICFTRAGGVDIGHLAPLPFSREAIEVICRNVETVRREIEAPLILENITYPHAAPGAEMSEADFLAEVLERSGCGMLLDVTNLHINSVNHHYDARAFLDRLPVERIVQLHFVGGHRHQPSGLLIDSHAHPTGEDVWSLMREVLRRAPVKGAILERDENLPPFTEIIGELERARSLGREAGRWA